LSLADVSDYASWVCCEDHSVPEQHEAELPQNERAFPEYSAPENDALCKLPSYIAKDDCSTMWDATNPKSENVARREGDIISAHISRTSSSSSRGGGTIGISA